MSIRKKEKSEHPSNLLALLDLTKERLIERKSSDAGLHMICKNPSLELDDYEDFNLSGVSSRSDTELSKNYILEQIAEIKELCKNQVHNFENFQHEFVHSPKSPKSPLSAKSLSPKGSADLTRPRLGSKEFIPRLSREGISSIESVFAKVISDNNEEEYSALASTLLGLDHKNHRKSSDKHKSQPVLKFIQKPKKLNFKDDVFIKSHLSFLNL